MHNNIDEVLRSIHSDCHSASDGQLPDYIPELTKVDPTLFAISLVTVDGQRYQIGDCTHEFTLQSIVKPFMYAQALEHNGRDNVLDKIGVEPSGDSYNAMSLNPADHRPFNPMVNAGAMALAQLIPGDHYRNRIALIKKTLDDFAGRELGFDEDVYRSEKNMGHQNRAMAHLLLNFNIIHDDPEDILEAYFQACSFLVTVKDLAVMAATLANRGRHPLTQQQVIKCQTVKDVVCVMMMCGMYDFSGQWAYTVGVPAKSGVSGGIIGVVPGRMGIAVYSPLLNAQGNSLQGICAFQKLSQTLNLSMF